jgi:hypothetical protein
VSSLIALLLLIVKMWTSRAEARRAVAPLTGAPPRGRDDGEM